MKKIFKFNSDYIKHLPDSMQETIDKVFEQAEDDELYLKRIVNSEQFKIDEEDERTCVGYVSTRTLDRDGEIVVPKGIDFTAYMKNPVILWNHNWSGKPIGSNKEVKSDDYGLICKSCLADTDEALEIWKLIKGGHLKTSSIGFVPLKSVKNGEKGFGEVIDKMRNYPEWKKEHEETCRKVIIKSALLEHSFVALPSNMDSVTLSVSEKSIEPVEVETEEVKRLTDDEIMENIIKNNKIKRYIRYVEPHIVTNEEIFKAIKHKLDMLKGKV